MGENTPTSYHPLDSESHTLVHGAGARSKPRVRCDERRDREPARSRDLKKATKRNSFRGEQAALPDRNCVDNAPFELVMLRQAPRTIQLGMPVETTVIASLIPPRITLEGEGASSLFTVATLVRDGADEVRTPLEPGFLMAPKPLDMIHPIPSNYQQMMMVDDEYRTILGYSHFPALIIRQVGTYRIRITLHRMNRSIADGATSLVAVDSEPIKVERRPGTLRPWQRL